MTKQFDRFARVSIINEGETRRDLGDLRVTFNVVATKRSAPNTMDLKIHNINETTANVLRGRRNTKAKIELVAGFVGDTSVLYRGDIIKDGVTISRQGQTETIAQIKCGDGIDVMRDTKLSISFGGGNDIKRVLQNVLDEIGMDIGDVKGLDEITGQFTNGFSEIGTMKSVLDKLTGAAGVDWSIQNDAIQILKPSQFRDESALKITPDTGLIGSPNLTKDGMKCAIQLNPKAYIGRKIVVESKFINGQYKINKTTHDGDNHFGSWQTQLECSEI